MSKVVINFKRSVFVFIIMTTPLTLNGRASKKTTKISFDHHISKKSEKAWARPCNFKDIIRLKGDGGEIDPFK